MLVLSDCKNKYLIVYKAWPSKGNYFKESSRKNYLFVRKNNYIWDQIKSTYISTINY